MSLIRNDLPRIFYGQIKLCEVMLYQLLKPYVNINK